MGSVMSQQMETRTTDWSDCVGGPWYPSMSHGGYVAYRVWQQFDGMRWFQRHEWKAANGVTEVEKWIQGVPEFLPGSRPLSPQDQSNGDSDEPHR